MDEVEFHREPPSNLPTLVTAFGGWIDAGEAATGAMRSLVRQLSAVPLAAIDPEDFVDFTQVRPVVRLSAEGERAIRWPRNAFWLWQPPQGGAGLLLAAVPPPPPPPIPGPHASRAAAPLPRGRHGSRRVGCCVARAMKARRGLPPASWTRRGNAAWCRATCGDKRPIICRGPRIRR